ncbi:MAG: hypothetical protein IJU01_06150 [Lachnospiraceae bacterium]|nr:hypothetical protein [Lachnospiraceae bacterium]
MKSIIRQLLLSFGIFLFAGLVLFAAPKNAAAMTETEYCRMFRYYAVLTDYQKEAYREVCSAIEKLQDEVIFSSAAMSIDEAGDVLTAISYDHPEYFWYGYEDINGQGSRYYNKERKVEKVMLNFNKYAFTGGDVENGVLSLEALNNNINLVETAADEILDGLSGKKDYEIEMYLHNQLAKDLSYNWEDYRFNLGGNVDGSDTSTTRLDLTIYNFLVQKKVICAGYARSFQYLMTRAGIPCYYAFGNARIVSSTTDEEGTTSYWSVEGNHAWNVVLIQGEYYAVDITWDDLYGETDSNGTKLDFNRIDYSYFNLTKSNFGKGTSLAGYHENDSRCINVMPELCENDSYESFYNETREQSYVREMVDPDGAPRQANISSLSQFKTMATNFYKKHGEGYYWIPFMTLSESVYSEIESYMYANGMDFVKSLASAGGFTLMSTSLRIYTYPLEMGMRHNYLIVRATSTTSTDTLYTGVRKGHDGGWYYYYESIFQSRYTGFQSNSNGRWRIENGKVNFNYSEVVYESGQWRYYSGGKWQKTLTSVEKRSNGTWWYIKNGVVQFGVEDIVKRSNGTWWYVKNGQVQFGVTSVEKRSNGTWWYVKGGQVQTKVTGLVKRTENNTWWYVKGGQVQFGATGVVKRADKNTWWYVKSGQLLTSFTGIAKRVDNSTKWYVKKGQVQTGYSGKITISGKKYTIKKGQVK